MSTPHETRNFVLKIKARNYKNVTETEFARLCQLALAHLPGPAPVRGKKCPFCTWVIGNATKICKNCGKDVQKRPRAPVPEDSPNDCMGECARDLTGLEAHELSCGHKYCAECMRKRITRGYTTCCMCDDVDIDASVMNKYLPDEV